MNVTLLFFLLVAAGAIGSAVMMVVQKNPVSSVLFMVLTFLFTAILYLFLGAQFVAAIQVLVYAGAIMVLFLFVVMLLNLTPANGRPTAKWHKKIIPVLFGLGLLGLLSGTILTTVGSPGETSMTGMDQSGTVEFIGNELFRQYLFPFEIVSIVLLVAIVGAVVLAKKRLE